MQPKSYNAILVRRPRVRLFTFVHSLLPGKRGRRGSTPRPNNPEDGVILGGEKKGNACGHNGFFHQAERAGHSSDEAWQWQKMHRTSTIVTFEASA
jgi:hypothetical protein